MKNRIRVVHGDITRLQVGAIVNAANASLMGGGGVDGAIHRAAGPALVDACKAIVARQGECATGEAVMTPGGQLPAAWVIHTVGPVWQGGSAGESRLLTKAYENCLRLAQQHDITSVAFPAISTGVYGYPKAEAANVAVRSVTDFLQLNEMPQQVYLVCFDEESFMLHQQALTRWLQDQQPLTPTDLEAD